MVYIIAFLLSLFFCYCSLHSRKEAKLLMYFISTLPLTFLSSFRYMVGTDYHETYELGFLSIKNGYDVNGYDWGFAIFNKLILAFTTNPQWLFFTTSIIISYFIFKAFYTSSKNILLSYYIYFSGGMYFMGMNQLKQFVGMSICLYCIHLFLKRKYISFTIGSIIAGLFHTVNYIFILPFLFVDKLKHKAFIKPLYVTVLLIAVYLISDILVGYFFNEVLILTRFYERYNESGFVESNFSLAYFIMSLFILLLYFYTYKKNKDSRMYILFYGIKILSTALILLSGQIMIIARVSDTFLITDTLSIPYVISKITKKPAKYIALIGTLALYGYYWYWSIFSQNNHGCFPYNYRLL